MGAEEGVSRDGMFSNAVMMLEMRGARYGPPGGGPKGEGWVPDARGERTAIGAWL